MQLQLNHVYIDRQGKAWRILETDGEALQPVTAARWEGKRYWVRTFQQDGRYFSGQDDEWDLVSPAVSA